MVPPPQAFFEPINWYRPGLHEMGHASGHHSRLNRDLTGAFVTKKYAFEELVADMNAAFCCSSLAIVPAVRHADHIRSSHQVMRAAHRAARRQSRPSHTASPCPPR